jgi:hypothetical protein
VTAAVLQQQIRSEFETWRKIIETTGFKADS